MLFCLSIVYFFAARSAVHALPFVQYATGGNNLAGQTILDTSHHPEVTRQLHHFVWGIADTFAEYVTVQDKEGNPLVGTLFWPNPNRVGYGAEEDFGNVADYKFLPDRPFNTMIQLTWIPITHHSGKGNGQLLTLPRGSVTLDHFVPLSPEQIGNVAYRESCIDEEFWGNITFMTEADCPDSLPEDAGCMELMTAPVHVKGNLREAMSRVHYGWEQDPNFTVEWESEAISDEKQKVQVHMIDSSFHLQEGYDVTLGEDGVWQVVGEKQMIATESIGPHKAVLPGTATRPWSGWFWRLIPVEQ